MAAILPEAGVCGAKVHSTHKGVFDFVIPLFCTDDRRLLSIIHGGALTGYRTAAVTHIAFDTFGNADAKVLAGFGTEVVATRCTTESGSSTGLTRIARSIRSSTMSRTASDSTRSTPGSTSRSPIHFTNELEVAASPETIWSLLVDTTTWPGFYPGVQHVQLLDGHETLRLDTRFETNLAGQDVFASVQEFEPMTRIAWGGYPKVAEGSRAYHAWIITPTANGCHLWTEETMQGPHWLELAKKAPDVFWLTHEKLLEELAEVATARERSRA